VAQLCTYLELLLLQDRQEKNIAAGQHAILLVSAYVKMNNVKKLDEFLEKYTIPDDFETEEAISVCPFLTFSLFLIMVCFYLDINGLKVSSSGVKARTQTKNASEISVHFDH
jgi:hypothetical protein